MKKYIFILILFFMAVPAMAETFWVRPAKDGVYGNADGSSYDDAWEPQTIVCGTSTGQISAGDTVYFSGVCIYYEEPTGQSATDIDITQSGTSGSPIIFRGDASSVNAAYADGELWGNYILTGARVSWTNNVDDTYKTAIQASFDSADGYFVFENLGSGWEQMEKVTSISACIGTPGSYYSSDYKAASDIYFHCSDNGDPDGRVSLPIDGHTWDWNGNDYIQIIALDMYCMRFNGTNSFHDITVRGSSVNDKMKICYSPAGNNAFAFRDTSYNITLQYIDRAYGGCTYANELVRHGFVVLCPDAFYFGSQRLDPALVSDRMTNKFPELNSNDENEQQRAFNRFASTHETLTAKMIFTAGTTWPGILFQGDRASVNYMLTRPEVDPKRIGCMGLSIGGFRSAHLFGLDPRIKTAVVAGWMTTYGSLLFDDLLWHTWMIYVPGQHNFLDLPDVASLNAPNPLMVINCKKDNLFPMEGMQAAEKNLPVFTKKWVPQINSNAITTMYPTRSMS